MSPDGADPRRGEEHEEPVMNDVRTPLDDLAHLVAGITDHDPARHVLPGVVADLERMSGAELPGDDVLPVLVRRFARAHRLLLGAGDPPAGAADRIARHAAVLRDPLAVLAAPAEATEAAEADRTAVPQPC